MILLVLYLAMPFMAEARCKNIILTRNHDIQEQLTAENTTYLVKWDFDLEGLTVKMPKKSCLQFEKGCLKNGIIEGNETSVSAEKTIVFANVTLSGTWDNRTVYSEWLDFAEGNKVDNARNFKNLMLLCKSDKMTHLYMQSGIYYCSVVSGSSNIQVPSNVYWHNSATLCQLPTNQSKFGFVLLQNSENVTIDGGVFVGDVQTHTGTRGEWGHGIKVGRGMGIVLKNFTAREFWGDGIDLIEATYQSDIRAGIGPCENVTIDNVKCIYNRRQGLSIEAAKNVEVKNSEFAYTGKYKMTKPGAGIDIEPWCKNEIKIDNIKIENCKIHDNNPERDLCVEANAQYFNGTSNQTQPPVNEIIVKKCKIGLLYVHGANKVAFANCEIGDISHYNHGEQIMMTDCKIKKRTGFKTRWGVWTPRSLTMTRCTH